MDPTEHFPLVGKLHTDVLESKYGPIHAVVLRHDDAIREAHLADGNNISRTYAVTIFPKRGVPRPLRKIDAVIKTGAPIGKAFRDAGYTIKKNVISVYVIDMPPWLRQAFRVEDRKAKVRLSEFYAKEDTRDAEPLVYGVVAEIYSPDFRSAEINDVDRAQVTALTPELLAHGLSPMQIWDALGNEDVRVRMRWVLTDAERDSHAMIEELRRQIMGCMIARATEKP